ncbi:MAG TPA: GNAT family N-acetyltransferase [Solirubrobacteraceae bacterium]|nr:GNAT family N-acetyltransferase [Solirubrobacteraceae bacterium]
MFAAPARPTPRRSQTCTPRVAASHQRRGVGSRLLTLTAETLRARSQPTALYLWVLEQNVEAQAFYRACGGRRVERAPVSPPGGIASRLAGAPAKVRYAWEEPAALLADA